MTGSSGSALVSVAIGVAVLLALVPAPAAPRRIRALAPRPVRQVGPSADRRSRSRSSVPIGVMAGRLVAVARAVRRLVGRPMDDELDRRLAIAVLVALMATVWHPAIGLVLGSGAWVGSWARRRSIERREADRLVDVVPDLVELFRLATAAGLNVHLAVAAVASRVDGRLGDDLRRVPARVARGERLADALDGFGRCGEPVRPLAAALAAAERYGDPLLPVLERLSGEARLVRRRHAEEVARRLPVQLLFPLVLCVLPAFVLLAVVPLLLAAVPQLPQ